MSAENTTTSSQVTSATDFWLALKREEFELDVIRTAPFGRKLREGVHAVTYTTTETIEPGSK